jgi:uncharacterized small protein (DUF1192 family)
VRTNRERLAVVATVALVLLAGGGGAGLGDQAGGGGDSLASSGDGGGGGAPDAEPTGEEAAATGIDAGASVSGQPRAERAIVRTAEVHVEVGSYASASESPRELVEARGGFVASSNREVAGVGNETWTRGRLVLQVPSENFSDVHAGAQAVGSVESANSDTQDVTDQLVDLNARIDNLEAERDRLRALYQNASDTEDVLAVGDRLWDVQGEIERLTAQREALRDRVALSTVTARLTEPRPDPTSQPRQQFHETGLVAAFGSSVNGVVVAVRSLAVAFTYALPYVLVFGLPAVGVVAIVSRLR